MSTLTDLYQEVILDHNKKPRNFGPLPSANHHAVGHNPLCGDKVSIHALVEEDTIRDVHFDGSGCAISKASASMMTEAVKGRTLADVEALFETFHALVTGRQDDAGNGGRPELGKLVVFSGVREFPVRVKCASLAWHTLKAALEDRSGVTSTE
ncbi:MAG TPA: SUF system NifU family Fe-S cluster assembly protein [Candidatus Polarisedimenticolia bacterium]|nr:SUF system NifU family Fe-S cluster assembly protein [Candidatus Polarisedimenticolia bacterium]